MKLKLLFLVTYSLVLMNFSFINTKDIIVIEFRDFFKNDTVSLSINKVRILQNKTLQSDESTGTTGEKIILKCNDNKYYVFHEGKKIFIADVNQKQILLKVSVNMVSSTYNIDVSRGKFVGFSKSDGNSLKMMQAAKTYIYD